MKILINLPTIGKSGIPAPWLLKFKKIQMLGGEIFINAGNLIIKLDLENKDIYSFNKIFYEIPQLEKAKNTKLSFILFCIKQNLINIFKLNRIKGNFDVIYSPSSVLDLIIVPYLLNLFDKKIKWVAVFDNTVPLSGHGNKFIRLLAWLFFKISLIFLKKADKIYVISEDLEKYMIKKGFNRTQIILSTNGIENDLIKKACKNNHYNIDALFIGRINEAKGIYDMLKVLNIVKEIHPNFQLAIMGDGDEKTKKNFYNTIKLLKLENNIQFLGYKIGIEKFNIIKSSKCFLFLSESESFGLSLLEAVCCGLPSFVYDLVPYRNIYKNNEVIVFEKNDYRAVAERMIKFFDKGDFSNKNGELLLGKYSWDKIAEIEFNAFKN